MHPVEKRLAANYTAAAKLKGGEGDHAAHLAVDEVVDVSLRTTKFGRYFDDREDVR
jgi:hypothetical protein